MTVSTSNIWKSAAAAARQPESGRPGNLHIGKTLRDLYVDDNASDAGEDFDNLLSNLAMAERSGSSFRNN